MRIQVTYAQFLTVLGAMGAQSVVFYAVSDGLVTSVMIRDQKFGGTAIQLLDGFPTPAAFRATAPTAIEVSAID